jgi:hypothetical protein
MKRRYGFTCLMLLPHAGGIDDHAGDNVHLQIVSLEGPPRPGEFVLALCSGAL